VAILELAPEDGEHIGPYRIVRLLGRGGMGEVFLAWDPDLQRSVAIKRIRHDSELGPTLRQRLLREAQTAGSLHHPSIVVVYHLLKCASDDCIVMEYVQGQTLAETLRDGPLELARAVGLAKEVAAGLAVAHAAGIIHRDLKAENVMITPAQAAKILDFGLAKPMGIKAVDPALTATGHVVGTRRSMSPEQLRGAEVDGRSDLFSLGVLLYEMLTGSSPFQGVNAPAILCQMFRSGAPPRLVALLERLLAQDPAARFQTAGEVVRELEAIAASLSPPGPELEETLSALPTEAMGRWGGGSRPSVVPSVPAATLPREESHQPRRGRRLKIGILISLAMVIVAVVVLFLWHRRFPGSVPIAPVRPKLLWVVVPNPQGPWEDSRFRKAASALVQANLRTLGFLNGIVPIGPVASSAKYQALMKGTAAEDVLATTLEQSGNRGLITLSRSRHGKVLWGTWFTAPIDEKDLPDLDREIETRLPDGFPFHPPRDDVSKEAYTAFFNIQQRKEDGHPLLDSDLPVLEALVARFPHFLEAQLLEAGVIVTVGPRNRERALQLVRSTKRQAPGDPRPLLSEANIALAEPRRAAIRELKKLAPDNPQIPALQANFESEPVQASSLIAWRKAVEYVPSWRNLLSLADVEEKLGFAEDARGHLMEILAEWKGNSYALRRLAELELDYGEPAKAETIYEDLLKGSPSSDDVINLGTARVLLHRYADAVQAFHEALKIDPENLAAMLNLADAELALDPKGQAGGLYEKVLQRWEAKNPPGSTAAAGDMMIKAQCLAHLGRLPEAKEIVRSALRQNHDDPDSPDLIRSAALVFALAGDYDLSIKEIDNAIAEHIGPNWFKQSSFAPLFKDPRFQRLVNGNSTTEGERQGSPVRAAPSSNH
jgi:serine/threonine protein kinase/tetratricopeptide (TPR) repeat protein